MLFQEAPEHVYAFDTCGLKDYSKYRASKWTAEEKQQRRKDVFPDDLEQAKRLGIQMAENIKKYQSEQNR